MTLYNVYTTKKSVCMLINSNKFDLNTSPTIKLGDTRLSYVSWYKYLGCLITYELSDNADIKKRYLCASKCFDT